MSLGYTRGNAALESQCLNFSESVEILSRNRDLNLTQNEHPVVDFEVVGALTVSEIF